MSFSVDETNRKPVGTGAPLVSAAAAAEGEVLRQQAAWWARTLAGAPELLALPTDHPRPAEMDHAAARLDVVLDEALTEGLKGLSRRQATPLFMTLLTGWAVVLGRLSGQDDVVIGTLGATRERPAIDGPSGVFDDVLALRVDLSGAPTVSELLARVRERAIEVQTHQNLPFEQVVERVDVARSLSHHPIFQVMFAWPDGVNGQDEPMGEPASVDARCDLSLSLREAGDRIAGSLTYAAALFEQATAERYVDYLRRVLREMAADESRSVGRLALLSESERVQILETWNRTGAAYPSGSYVHELFEAQVARTPGAVAVVHSGVALTYAELNARANRLAHYLRALGVGPDARAAVCVERGADLVMALLAVLKAGGAYVPLDPDHPDDRLRAMLEDSAPAVLLTRGAAAARVGGLGMAHVDLAADAGKWRHQPETNPERAGGGPERLAYVIYTSGSTGRPKGVMVAHRGVVNILQAMRALTGIGPDDSVLSVTTVAFDIAVLELFLPLVCGARTLLLDRATAADGERLADAISSLGVTFLQVTPATWRLLIESGWTGAPGLRALCGGEALPATLAAAIGQRVGRLWNMYGPTETTIWSSAQSIGAAVPGPAAVVPIGAPLANTRFYVLDAMGEPVPVGVAGELYIGGAGVARGYLDRPALTAERFLADPFGSDGGARLYRTGDRARWRPDGTIEYLGRTDHQVKIRGFRIELGEIEARLAMHPAVREAVVLAREDASGDRRLVAYWVGTDAAPEDFRADLSTQLPEYMVPAAYVRLDALPLTPNGKLDRKALPVPEDAAYATRVYEAPVGETEQALAGIWSELFGMTRVGRHDNFFELGGDSLLAVRAVWKIRAAFGRDVTAHAIRNHPSIQALAQTIGGAGIEADAQDDIGIGRPTPLPATVSQKAAFFFQEVAPQSPAYQFQAAIDIRGPLDVTALQAALSEIVRRHEIYRTTFPVENGVLVQRIHDPWEVHLAPINLSRRKHPRQELQRLLNEEFATSFSVDQLPLIRWMLFRCGRHEHVLVQKEHHFVHDGWSFAVCMRELLSLYEDLRQGRPSSLPAPRQFADYAVREQHWLGSREAQAQLAYWKHRLQGASPILNLPTDRPRPERMTLRGNIHQTLLGPDVANPLREFCRRHAVTSFVTMMSAFEVLMSRYSRQEDFCIGTGVSNRHVEAFEDVIGMVVNTVPLRVDVGGDPAAAALIARVRATSSEAFQHEQLPFSLVAGALAPQRSLSHLPIYQVAFSFHDSPMPGPDAGDLEVTFREVLSNRTAKADVSVIVIPRDERTRDEKGSLGTLQPNWRMLWEYSTDLFDPETIDRMAAHYVTLLREFLADPDRRISELPLLPEAERSRVLDAWNQTDAAYPRESCVHALFEAQAARTPDATAVVFERAHVTYAELNRRANRLAHSLRERGVGPDVRVAICVERSLEMVIGFLAVLKARGAYVPLDPSDPSERLACMLADSTPAVVLTGHNFAARFHGLTVPVVALDAEPLPWASKPSTNPAVNESVGSERAEGLTPEHLAYVMYTSGSTGRPKGVMVPHRAIVRLIVNNGYAAFGPDDRVACAANPAFDAATLEVWAPLVTGGVVAIIDQDSVLDPSRFAMALRTNDVNVLWLTVGLFNQYADALQDEWRRLRYLIVGGDALDPRVMSRVLRSSPPTHLLNGYGPTETTTFAVTHEISQVEEGARSIPLGRPISNTRTYVLDERQAPVPVGVAGELCIGGAGVSRGYLGRPALTAERFIADPYGDEPGARLYRTGDLCRWRPDGTLEFLGRTDHQVKVRGFRIEPGEIEARLAEHPRVREAVVVAREDTPGEKRLVAYIVAADTVGGDTTYSNTIDADTIGAEALRAYLSERLPSHMVPAAYVRLDALPLTPNGKVDRNALPVPAGDAYAVRTYEAPVGETEQALAGIWAEVLRCERVGRWDHFFELGGHSLLAMQVIARARPVLQVDVKLGDLFTRPVFQDFARELKTAARVQLPPIAPTARDGRVPLSFAQQRLWFLEQLGEPGSAYHIHRPLRLRGALDRTALVRALDAIVVRHEALRTTFAQVDGSPEQRTAPAAASRFQLIEHDLIGHDLIKRADADAELDRLMSEEAHTTFSLERGPLIRGRLIRLAGQDHGEHHLLLITMHHIVSDGWSMRVLFRELSALYAAHRDGREADLPALPVQYADYAAWQRQWVEGDVLREQAAWWAETLAGAPEVLELPTDHPRPAEMDHAGARFDVVLDEALTAALKALSRRQETTLFMTVLAGWAVVLGWLSGREDVVIGTPTANRGRQEIEGLIGFFVNTLALRVDLSGTPTVAELLARVKRRVLDAQHHQDLPFEQVVERLDPVRSLAHHPLFQVMFAWQNTPGRDGLTLPGLAVSEVNAPALVTAKFDLSLSLQEAGDRIVGRLTYASTLFERETVERYVGYLRRGLEAMAADAGRPVERLALMSASERAQVLEAWNQTAATSPAAAYPSASLLHELFTAQVAQTPDATAVVFEEEHLTYAELNARANQLAHHLRAIGVGPDVRVGLCVERSAELMVGLLGVLKAGGAYVALDPGYPAERLSYMLADSAPAAVLTQTHLRDRIGTTGVSVLDLDASAPVWGHQPETNPACAALTPSHLAYVIYTSGSTGRPKGVGVPHRAVVNALTWMEQMSGLGGEDAVVQKTPYSFDASLRELLPPLLVGARLVLARPEGHKSPSYLVELLEREQITTFHGVPSLLQVLAGEEHLARCAALRTVMCGGEALPTDVARRFSRQVPWARLFNVYGPTEAAVDVTAWPCREDGERVVTPIGRPMANVRIYLLDQGGEPVPVGVAGELHIGGMQVARGYLGRPAQTSERFIADPYGGEPGARLYRTGDLARWRPDGTIEYVGRMDHQVKVRGFRIEPGEIEARLTEHAAVREAVVLARTDTPGHTRLVAYWVGDDRAGAEVLRAHVSEALPEYMVPAAYVRLETWPLLPNGKLDRKALPVPADEAYVRRGYEAPVGEIEETLAEIWSEVLGVERVGRWDHFFELGGHSLLAVKLLQRMRSRGLHAEVRTLFLSPTLADFSATTDQLLELRL